MFTRTRHYCFSIPKEQLQYRLVGNHMTIARRDFEVAEDDQVLSVRPVIEDAIEKDALPITYVLLREAGNRTEMVLTSKMPVIQAGGQIVMMIFSVFLLAASLLLLYLSNEPLITYSLCGLSIAVFVFFLIRLQLIYFGYVRKIRSYMKGTAEQITTDVRKQLFKHKMK